MSFETHRVVTTEQSTDLSLPARNRSGSALGNLVLDFECLLCIDPDHWCESLSLKRSADRLPAFELSPCLDSTIYTGQPKCLASRVRGSRRSMKTRFAYATPVSRCRKQGHCRPAGVVDSGNLRVGYCRPARMADPGWSFSLIY